MFCDNKRLLYYGVAMTSGLSRISEAKGRYFVTFGNYFKWSLAVTCRHWRRALWPTIKRDLTRWLLAAVRATPINRTASNRVKRPAERLIAFDGPTDSLILTRCDLIGSRGNRDRGTGIRRNRGAYRWRCVQSNAQNPVLEDQRS